METVEQLKAIIKEYEKRMGIGEDDPARDAYLVYIEMLRQRKDFLKEFKLKDKIGSAVKDDPVYARAIDLIDSLPKMISSASTLRLELKMDGEESKVQQRPITAKEIANGVQSY